MRKSCLALSVAVAGAAQATTVTFDTSRDVTGFFAPGSQAEVVLNAAEQYLSGLLDDELEAIIPSGSNSWQMFYTDPTFGIPTFEMNPTVAADTLVVYVGARDLGAALGEAGPGASIFNSGDQAWQETLQSRGEGAGDFGPWGGSLSVSSTVNWDYGTDQGEAGKFNLYSTIIHEMGHVLGLGLSDSWNASVDSVNDEFLGSASVAEYGGPVPLTFDEGHWVEGTLSSIFGTSTQSETAFDPTLALGDFKPYTDLDVAALQDIGWDVVPEPSQGILLLWAAALGLCRRRRPIRDR